MLACHREKVADGILGNVQNLAIAVTYTHVQKVAVHAHSTRCFTSSGGSSGASDSWIRGRTVTMDSQSLFSFADADNWRSSEAGGETLSSGAFRGRPR
jgi:hypothetical protein